MSLKDANKEIQGFLTEMTPIDFATYIPASMPEPVLNLYLSLDVEHREVFFDNWLSGQ